MVLSKAAPAYQSNLISNKKSPPAVSNFQNKNSGAILSKESLRVDTLHLSYKNGDGDTLGLRFQSVNYQSEIASVSSEQGANREELVSFIRDELLEAKREIISILFGHQEGESTDSADSVDESQELELNIPEYWNAENTSDRIVDFALSFFELHEGEAGEYFEQIKAGIEEGFSQAKQMLGAVPEAVSNLTESTYDLVMSKLDTWAQEQDIAV